MENTGKTITIPDFESKFAAALPETQALLARANLTVHQAVRRIVLHGSRGLAGNSRPDSDIDLSLIAALPPGLSENGLEDFLHKVYAATQGSWRGEIEADLAVVYETRGCGLACFEWRAWEQGACTVGGVDCFGLYKAQKGFNGIVRGAGVQVSRMFPCVTVWEAPLTP